MKNKDEKELSDQEVKEKKEEIGDNLNNFLDSIGEFLKEILSIRQGTDIKGTIESIKKDMVFRGPTVWILIASIFIASIGLNINSIPVVIGAMLISPLMGPILGIGLSVGTNDWETLIKSLKNFGVAIAISLLTSTIYFLITPLKEASPELISRTTPTILDVLIGIFGGIAGIVAGSRKEKSNVIPGVAIATALMPPLCTAGYGIATAQFNFFFGAFYLFFLNSVFIALSTLVFVRYLKFPKKSFVNHKREKKLKRYMTIFIILVILPSANLFLKVIQETRFNANSRKFIQENLNFKKAEIINKSLHYSDTLSTIDIYLIGNNVREARIKDLNSKLAEYGLMAKGNYFNRNFLSITDSTILRIHQAEDNSDTIFNRLNYISNNLGKDIKRGILEDIYKNNEEKIQFRNEKIEFLENQLYQLKKDSIPFYTLSKEIKIQYPKIKHFTYANAITLKDSGQIDTISTFIIKWNKNSWRAQKNRDKLLLSKWLKVRLNIDTLNIIEY